LDQKIFNVAKNRSIPASVAEPEPLRRGGYGSSSSSSSRQNGARKVNFFHLFCITIRTKAPSPWWGLHCKIKVWCKLKKMFWEIFFLHFIPPWSPSWRWGRSRSRQNWGDQSRQKRAAVQHWSLQTSNFAVWKQSHSCKLQSGQNESRNIPAYYKFCRMKAKS